MVYFDEAKIVEMQRKWKPSRNNFSIRLLLNEIALMEAELIVRANASPSASPSPS
jgi:hypothetical protein